MCSNSSTLAVVDIPKDCGNAPRKIVIRDFLIALYSGDLDQTLEMLTDDVRWEVVGSHVLAGKAETRSWLMHAVSAQELKLHTVITHGTDCGADGVATYENSRTACFNHVIVFSGHAKTAKISEIRSYLIDG